MSHHIVAVTDLHYAYADGTPALQGISFRIEHGESVAIVGANGAGKSTLLLHLNGYFTPQRGTVQIGDFALCKELLPQVRRTVGMLFQDPDDQLFMPTVRDDVAFGPLNLGLSLDEVESRVAAALRRVGAEHLADRPPYRLSGGEKRAVAIASILSMQPQILVMDEPTTGLDPAARRRLIELLATFHHTRIIATHDLDLVLDLCPRTIVIHQGQVMADRPTLEIFHDADLLQRSHLEAPLRLQSCPVCAKRLPPPHDPEAHHHHHHDDLVEPHSHA
jgi:cobalt/nickel transport system ATP-binding protein